MGQTIVKILGFLSSSLNLQLKLRVPAHLRAVLFGLCLSALGFSLYRGWINETEGATIFGVVVSIFGLTVQKSAPGENGSMSLSQATTAAEPKSGASTLFTPQVSAPVLPGDAAVVVSAATSKTLVKLDLVSSKPVVAVPVRPGPVVAVTPVEVDVVKSKAGAEKKAATDAPVPDTLDMILTKAEKAHKPGKLKRLK